MTILMAPIECPNGKKTTMYQLLAMRSGLKIEIKTGMKLSKGSILSYLRAHDLTDARTKAKALEDLELIIADLQDRYNLPV